MNTQIKESFTVINEIKPTLKKWVEIDLEAFRNNIKVLKDMVGNTTEIVAIVKADAYGHGIERLVQTAESEGIQWFGVADTFEGIALRNRFKHIKILLLGMSDEEFVGLMADGVLE